MNDQLDRPLSIAGKTFSSRLMLGTGKYHDSGEMLAAFEAAQTEIVTVALRRIDFDDPKSRSVLEDVDWKRYTILPNTAGCQTAEEAVRIARMAGARAVRLDQARGHSRSEVPAPRPHRHL